jgi:DNA polymerase elongation subunit (family B)
VESNVTRTPLGYSEHTLRLGWAVYWRRASDKHLEREDWQYFTTKAEFWNWVDSHVYAHTKTVIVAHNIVYDFMVCDGLHELAARGYTAENIITGEGIQLYTFHRKSTTLQFLDSMNIFSSSLAKLGQDIGIPKIECNPLTATDEQLIPYCKQDVNVLLQAFKQYLTFLRREDMGAFAVTRAGQAFNCYRHRFMRHDIMIHTRPDVIELERTAYFGGRVQCNYIGKSADGPFYQLDVNAMYPYVMRHNPYPVLVHGPARHNSLKALENILSKYLAIARVTLETDEPAYPVRRNGLLLFPTGRFTTTLTTPELQYAQRKGHIVSVGDVTIYNHAYIFTEFVESLYQIRLRYKRQGNDTYSMFCKLFLNSLYGKFGQRSPEWETVGTAPLDMVDYRTVYDMKGNQWKEKTFGGLIQRSENTMNAWNAFVAVAAHVTAYARVLLYELCMFAGWENVYYTDTDAMIVNATGYARLAEWIDTDKLGYLKLERQGHTIDIRAAKDYTFGGVDKRKGIPHKAKLVGPDAWEVEVWPSLLGLTRANHLSGYYTYAMTKRPTYEYTRGIVTPSGWTRPFQLAE